MRRASMNMVNHSFTRLFLVAAPTPTPLPFDPLPMCVLLAFAMSK